MTLFKTTPEQAAQLDSIASAMEAAGVPHGLVDDARILAQDDQGIFELLVMWRDEPDEREAVLEDLWNHLRETQLTDDFDLHVLIVALEGKKGPTPEGGHRFTLSTEECQEIARALRAAIRARAKK